MRVLFLENDDSFSWNVVDALPFAREEIEVRPGREPGALRGFDALVIGPGPTDPERAGLVSVVREAARLALPTLGVCLGHQAIGVAFGAVVARATPVHGKPSVAVFRPSSRFPGTVGPRVVMRYHSLSLTGVRPPLRVVAETGDGVVMAVEHESLPMAGVQFHPDSCGTPDGRAMFADFFGALP